MLKNLFTKKVPAIAVEQKEVETLEPTKKYPDVVYQIHHEFEIASEQLVLQANAIIAEAGTKDVDKVSRLEKFGFKQVKQVVEIKPLIQKAELSKEQIEFVRYYQLNYPNNKFITEEQVKTICHKYNLVCGEVGLFKGFVPEKNLRDIESFKIKEPESKLITTQRIRSTPVTNFSGKLTKGEMKDLLSKGTIIVDDHWVDIATPVLQICAPVKDMDLTGKTITEGYKVTEIHIPDPVVLQPVKGGYLILTAWGDEANDELVVNNKMN